MAAVAVSAQHASRPSDGANTAVVMEREWTYTKVGYECDVQHECKRNGRRARAQNTCVGMPRIDYRSSHVFAVSNDPPLV
jgi:hypothetical protein